jgi:hypothetical protein
MVRNSCGGSVFGGKIWPGCRIIEQPARKMDAASFVAHSLALVYPQADDAQ